MEDSPGPVAKEFNYAAFVNELTPLIAQARAFGVSDGNADSQVFRTHMDSDTRLRHRQFRVLIDPALKC